MFDMLRATALLSGSVHPRLHRHDTVTASGRAALAHARKSLRAQQALLSGRRRDPPRGRS